MIRTDADNSEINTLLKKWDPPQKEWDGDLVCKYLNENLTTGTVENINKKENADG